MGASSSSPSLEASPQPPASLGSPWKRLCGLLDTPARHGRAVTGPLARQPALCRVHPSGSCLLHASVLPQHPPSQGALAPASRAAGHLCPASQLIPEEAMQAERNFEILQATPFPPALPACCISGRLRLRRDLAKVTQGSHGLCLPLAHLLSTPTAARKPWEPWGGEEGSCRVRSKGGFPSSPTSPLTPQPVARPPTTSQGHTPAGRARQGTSSLPVTPPSSASHFLCSPNSPESAASCIGIASSQEQGAHETPGPQGGLEMGVSAGRRRG